MSLTWLSASTPPYEQTGLPVVAQLGAAQDSFGVDLTARHDLAERTIHNPEIIDTAEAAIGRVPAVADVAADVETGPTERRGGTVHARFHGQVGGQRWSRESNRDRDTKRQREMPSHHAPQLKPTDVLVRSLHARPSPASAANPESTGALRLQ